MLAAGPQVRLASIRSLMTSAAALDAALDAGRRGGDGSAGPEGGSAAAATPRRRGKKAAAEATPAAATPATPAADGTSLAAEPGPEADGAVSPAKATASDRRSAAATLLRIWASVARDVAVAGMGGVRQLGSPELIEEFQAAARGLPADALPAFLARLAETGQVLDENVNPELALDVLALAWPRPVATANAGAPAAAPSSRPVASR